MKIGIANQNESRERTRKIARGELKPSADEPKYWFPSVEAAEVAIASGMLQTSGDLEFVDMQGKPIDQSQKLKGSVTQYDRPTESV